MLQYRLDDRPGILPMLVYGVQWWVVSLPSVVIMGAVLARMHYIDIASQTLYTQKVFMVMGAVTIVQVLWGHRLPLVVGPASVLLVGVMSTLATGIAAIYTSIALGGAVLMLTAWSGLLNKLHTIFTPRVIAVVLMLIALSITPVVLALIVHNTPRPLHNLFFSLGLVLALVLGNKLLQGMAKATIVLWGLLLGSLAYHMLWGVSEAPPLHPQAVTGYPSFFVSGLAFDTGALLAFLFCFVALVINEVGSIESVAHQLGADNVEQRTRKGITLLGLSNVACGSMGVVGLVDYSLSTGVIAATRCASRYTLIPAGAGLIACGFFPGFIQIVTGLPGPVMGALLLYLMASQLAAGMGIMVKETAISDFASGLTVGLPLMVALLVAYTPGDVFAAGLPLLRPIVGNGFLMGCITVLVLEHCVFRQNTRE